MSKRRTLSLVRTGSLLAIAALLAACTKGGQFDPTSLLDSDMFNTKKPLQGQREPVFPNGVPGAANGIPADLYKGYQPPPEQAADTGEGATAAVPDNQAAKPEREAKPKPKPKPKIARAPAQPHATINVGLGKQPQGAPQQQVRAPQPAQTAWPNPNQSAQPAQTAWPNPNQTAQPAQTAWPNPTGPAPAGQ
jgi:outer membrane biosynthesis protein TonB